MSKSLLAAVLLPLVACSAKNAKPEYAASEASDVTTSEQQDSHLYEPEDDATADATGTTAGTTGGSYGTTGATAGTMGNATGDQPGMTTGGGLSNDVTAQAERTFAEQMITHHEEGIQLAKLAQQRAEHEELKQLASNMVTKQEAQLSELKMLTSTSGDLGSDDGLEDLHGQLNTTRSPAPSSDVTAMHDGVEPTAQDGLTAPTGADETASAADEDKTASTTGDASATGELGYTEGDETARNTGAMPSDDVETTASTGANAGANVPGDDMTASQQPGEQGEDAQADVPKDLDALASAEDFDKAFLDAMIQHHEKGIAMARAVSPRLEGEAKQLADAIVQSQSEEVAKMKGWQQAWFESDTVSSM